VYESADAMKVLHVIPEERWPTAEEARAALLFSPLALARGVALRTRSWVPAMVPWRATEGGEVTPAVVDWYARFADGRPGALVVEATGVRDVPSGPLLRASHDRYVDGLARLADAVRARSGGETRSSCSSLTSSRSVGAPSPRSTSSAFSPSRRCTARPSRRSR
jgi:hypothetical protein